MIVAVAVLVSAGCGATDETTASTETATTTVAETTTEAEVSTSLADATSELTETEVARLDLAALAEISGVTVDQLRVELMPDGRVALSRASSHELAIVDWDGNVETIVVPAEIADSLVLYDVQTTGVAMFLDSAYTGRSYFLSVSGNSRSLYLGWIEGDMYSDDGEVLHLIDGAVELGQQWESGMPIAAPGSGVVAAGFGPDAAQLIYPSEWFADRDGNFGALDVDWNLDPVFWQYVTVNAAGFRREFELATDQLGDTYADVMIQADHAYLARIDQGQLIITMVQ